VQGEIAVGPIFAPSANVGAIWEFVHGWRAGLSFQGPFAISAPATLRTRLPAAPVFDGATQSGEDATVSFDLPWTLRLGVETRALVPDLRLEVAVDYAAWSMHDSIDVEPDGVSLDDIASLPEQYFIPPVRMERGFQDAVGVRLGGEYALRASDDLTVDLRAGVSYETSGVKPEYLTVLTVDANKVTPAIGAGLHVGDALRFDAVLGYVIAETVEVDPADAQVSQIVPVLANPVESPDVVNGGTYASRAIVLGLGVEVAFDRPRAAAKEAPLE
jgi:long-chain fatty acid transport protein